MPEEQAYKTALYMRLSKDDYGVAESASITTQRKMLRCYAADKGYFVVDEYVDDGYSGTNFDRPGFKRMIADIEAKKLNLVITKDLSRLGRDYITAGQYTEIYFPSKGVRYIAINDGYDSNSPNTDIAPFKNVINEMYARDISKKIRSAFITKMHDGAYIAAFAPYGYQKDTSNKNHLVIDERSGQVVKQIFYMAANGSSPIEIARTLNMNNTPPPAVYRCMNHDGLNMELHSKRKEWTSSTVTKLLQNIVYLGHIAQGKTTKISFKSGLSVRKSQNEWIVVKNKHEALVDEETFAMARRRTAARTCEKKGKFYNIFSGIAKCAECGRNMSATGTRKKNSQANLTCGSYKLHGAKACSNHFIDYNVLYNIVLNSLKEQLCIGGEQFSTIVDDVQMSRRPGINRLNSTKELCSARLRLVEIDNVIGRLYEDNAANILSDARMNKLLLRYECEAKTLEKRIAAMEAENALPCQTEEIVRDKLEKMLQQVIDTNVLWPKLLFKLIDRIEIGQGSYKKDEKAKTKHQTVKIYYRFKTPHAKSNVQI